ncbi:GHKL domain-containing protein [Nitrincola iocasae]|uniref:histidine kinase n=2 Tax=Nitrincola iocasae TaxID=2614693 RepID=A0A5J6LH83_9GAMM|nr:GHKL domain-containing protein [Nitrincola iocasae]
MQTNSIRFWLLIALNSIVLASLSFTAYVSYQDALHELDEMYDAQLVRNARLIGALVESADPAAQTHYPIVIATLELPANGETLSSAQERSFSGHKYEQKLAFQVWRNNALLLQSENSVNFPELVKLDGFHEIVYQHTLWIAYVTLLSDGETWVMTAQREDIREEMSAYLALAQIRPILVVMIPLSVFIYLIIGLTLRPLRLLEQTISTKSPEQLSEITLPLPTELQPIKLAINQLINRVSHYVTQEKRFVSDAAHELRTPISVLQLHAENLQEATKPEETAIAVDSILDGSRKMTHLVNQLLQLNRIESLAETSYSTINLTELIQNSLSLLPFIMLDRIKWKLDIPENINIKGDEFLLGLALRNLLENAAKYAVPESEAVVKAQLEDDSVLHISISNKAQSLPDTDRMGDRFFRHQVHQHIEGCGLGLSIVEHVAKLHGGSVFYQLDNQILSVNIILPQ